MINDKNNEDDEIIDFLASKEKIDAEDEDREKVNLVKLLKRDLNNDPNCKTLSKEEQFELVKRIEKGDEEAEEKLLKSVLFLILKGTQGRKADKSIPELANDRSINDLFFAGYKRVQKEIKKIRDKKKNRFDWKKGNNFSTFIFKGIKGAIDNQILGNKDLKASKDFNKARRELEQKLLRQPVDQEIADYMGIPLKRLWYIQAKHQFNHKLDSLNAELTDEKDNSKYNREQRTSSEVGAKDDIRSLDIEKYEKITPEERAEKTTPELYHSNPHKILVRREQKESVATGRATLRKNLSEFTVEYLSEIVENGQTEIKRISQKLKEGIISEKEHYTETLHISWDIQLHQRKAIEDFLLHKSLIDFVEILDTFKDFIGRTRKKYNITVEKHDFQPYPKEWERDEKTLFILHRNDVSQMARKQIFFSDILKQNEKKYPFLEELKKDIAEFIQNKINFPKGWIDFYLLIKLLYDENLGGFLMDLVGMGTNFPIKISDVFDDTEPNAVLEALHFGMPYGGRLHKGYWWYYFRKKEGLSPTQAYSKMRKMGFNFSDNQQEKERYLKGDRDILEYYENKFLDR